MTTTREQQIRAIYRAALERPPGERASVIAALSGGDQEICRSVERLLSQDRPTDAGAPAETNVAADLPSGTRIGQYRIEAVLGRGGMGVVYRATDTKLNRPVAIKFLSIAAADAQAQRRFQQEARTASGLNHPHIVMVHDVGEIDGRQYIVSELVDGGTLEDWARAKRRSWRQCVELLTGVADALAAAHAAGVLHRDVKPGNVLIGGNGYAKLADFGLAKLIGGPERTSRETRAGVVVGTVAYMSPEQAAGQPLDDRSDVFSFGVVLYELLAGHRPFDAPTEIGVLKAIAEGAHDPLPGDVPEPLRVAVDKALEKDPADRYQSIRDLVVDLRRAIRKPTAAQTAADPTRRRVRRLALLAAALGVALCATLVPAALWFMRQAPPTPRRMHFEISAPGYVLGGLAISPDGTQISYASFTRGRRQLFVRPIGGATGRPLAGTENARGAFWSPDGRKLAFVADARLKTIDVETEFAQTLTDAAFPLYVTGSWDGDSIWFTMPPSAPDSAARIGRISSSGGVATAVTTSGPSTRGFHGLPRPLPDGEHFLYAVNDGVKAVATVYVGAVGSAARAPVLELTAANPTLLGQVGNLAYAGGYLLYTRGSTLVAQRFDADARVLHGEPLPIAENVGDFAVSRTGVLVYHERVEAVRDAVAAARRLTRFARDGRRLADVDPPTSYNWPVLSPDGRRIAGSQITIGPSDLWSIDVQRGVPTRLTFDDADNIWPVWSPDGEQIAYSSGTRAVLSVGSRIYVRAANGTGGERLLYDGAQGALIAPWDWSRDGRFIFFGRSQVGFAPRTDVWVVPTSGDEPAFAILESPSVKQAARLSPDGRFLAYATNESGTFQIVVQPFPNVDRGKWQVSAARGGFDPRWRRDGAELFYLDPDGSIMAVDVRTAGDSLQYGLPHELFATQLTIPVSELGAQEYLYDVSSDGQEFLINGLAPASGAASETPASQAPINVIVNWSVGLEAQ